MVINGKCKLFYNLPESFEMYSGKWLHLNIVCKQTDNHLTLPEKRIKFFLKHEKESCGSMNIDYVGKYVVKTLRGIPGFAAFGVWMGNFGIRMEMCCV